INFDLAGSHIGVDRRRGAGAHLAGNLQDILATHLICQRKIVRAVRIKDDLHDAVTVAQVDENHPAVVTTTIYPTTKSDFLIDKRGIQSATVFTAHNVYPID